MTELSNQNKPINKWSWFLNLFRYSIASFLTWITVSIPPIILLVILFGLSAFSIFVSWISFLFLVAEIEEGLQIVFWFVIAPIFLLLASIVVFFIIILLAGVFTFIFVLPFSYLSETINEKLFSSSFFSRVLSTFITSILAGGITGLIVWLIFIDSQKTTQFFWILISFFSTSFTLALFGITTTFIKTVSNYAMRKSKN